MKNIKKAIQYLLRRRNTSDYLLGSNVRKIKQDGWWKLSLMFFPKPHSAMTSWSYHLTLPFIFPDRQAGWLCESGWDLWFWWEVQSFSGRPRLLCGHQLPPRGRPCEAQGVLPRWDRCLLWQRGRRHQRHRDHPGTAPVVSAEHEKAFAVCLAWKTRESVGFYFPNCAAGICKN